MEKIIENSKLMIDEQVFDNEIVFIGKPFQEYQKVYFSTNENIKDYINYINFSNKNNALTVLSSGDHLFNLIEKGILNIDTFDINKFTEFYVFGIKFALILKYNYKDYLKIISILINEDSSLEEITAIIDDLLPYMNNKYRKYWRVINEYNYKIQKENKTNLNLIYLLTLGSHHIDNIIFRNNYLSNEITYNNLKNNITKTNITFKSLNAINLCKYKKYNKEYDLILLSNIVGYLGKYFYSIVDFDEYINNLVNMLKENGILFLEYIFNSKMKLIKENIHFSF